MQRKIELTYMSQQAEVRCPGDDWTGTNNSAMRRKLQNRLNQRIYRQRRRATSKSCAKSESDSMNEASILQKTPVINEAIYKCAPELLSITDLHNENKPKQLINNPQYISPVYINIKQWVTGRVSRYQGFTQLRLKMAKFEEEAHRNYMMGSPRSDQLLTLIQFNVFRALMNNTRIVGWNLDWLDCTIDPLSPWLNICLQPVPETCYPQALRPTLIQRTIPHHPWIDLWPIPKMRDNLLLHIGSYDEDQLCNDLVEFGGLINEQTGLIVWGEPWDIWGWEVSETFLRNWGWALKGCGELLTSTNAWRAKRGEDPIVFEV